MTKLFIAVGILVAGFLIYIAMQPSQMMIAREISINASPHAIFPYINNSKKTNDWMPWQDSDPDAKIIYSGPDEGVGSTSSWDSEGKMGTGKAVVVESVHNERVKTQLTYTKPMQMSQLAEISLTPSAGSTIVRWSVTGHNSFVGRVFCFFMNMDKLVGTEFEKGLAKLKRTLEGR